MGRAPCCDKANVKRGPWSPEEDATLKDYLHKHGTGGNWISLPQRAGLKRCGKSCRLRWLNYLRPDIKHGAFSEEEDNIIISLYYKMGSRWSIIAANLPGRTDNDVKNHWNTKLKKKLFGGTATATVTNNTNNNLNNYFNPCTIPKTHDHVPFTNYTTIFNNSSPSFSQNTPTHTPTPTYLPSFSTLLAQCTISPMSLLPNNTNLGHSFDPAHNSLNYFHPQEEASSASGSGSSSNIVYGSSLEDDPFFAELGFGSVMMNSNNGDHDHQEDIKPQGLGQSVAN